MEDVIENLKICFVLHIYINNLYNFTYINSGACSQRGKGLFSDFLNKINRNIFLFY